MQIEVQTWHMRGLGRSKSKSKSAIDVRRTARRAKAIGQIHPGIPGGMQLPAFEDCPMCNAPPTVMDHFKREPKLPHTYMQYGCAVSSGPVPTVYTFECRCAARLEYEDGHLVNCGVRG